MSKLKTKLQNLIFSPSPKQMIAMSVFGVLILGVVIFSLYKINHPSLSSDEITNSKIKGTTSSIKKPTSAPKVTKEPTPTEKVPTSAPTVKINPTATSTQAITPTQTPQPTSQPTSTLTPTNSMTPTMTPEPPTPTTG